MYPSGPHKYMTDLKIYNSTRSAEEHSNLTSHYFRKQPFGTKYSHYLHLLEVLLFAACRQHSRKARHHSSKQWKLVKFVHRTGWVIPAFATGDSSSAHKQNNSCRQLLFPH